MASSRIGKNKLRRTIITASLGAISVALLFQNCSQNYSIALRQVDDVPALSSAQSQVVEIDMSKRTDFPALKMVFVVDNSYTMKEAHQNLSKSFGAMFEGKNSSNLTPFNSSVYLISTAQKNGGLSVTASGKLPSLGDPLPGTFDSVALASHRSTALSGKIAGDIFGLQRLDKSNPAIGITEDIQYLPAPVLGIEMLGGVGVANQAIRKLKGEGASILVDDFVARLKILDPERNLGNYNVVNSVVNGVNVATKIGEFNEVLDNESGLCAVARMLRNSDKYFQPGDIASFVVVSDEDENDPSGVNCIQSTKKWNTSTATTTTKDYVTGECRKDQWATQVKYSLPGTDDLCRTKYVSGFKVATTYQRDRTKVVYWTYSDSTKLSFFKPVTTQNCTSNDGVNECDAALTQYVSATATVSGNQESACLSAVTLAGGYTANPGAYPFSCVSSRSYSQKTVYKLGNYAGNCSLAYDVISGPYAVDAAHLPSCSLASETLNGPSLTVNYPSAWGEYTSDNQVCRSDLLTHMQSLNANTSTCKVTLVRGQNTPEPFTSSCSTLAQQNCTSSSGAWAQCTGQTVAGTAASNPTVTIQQPDSNSVSCASSCADVSWCSGFPSLSLAEYLENKKGAIAGSCSINSTSVANPQVSQAEVELAKEPTACSAGFSYSRIGSPYPKQITNTASSSGSQTDLVAGGKTLKAYIQERSNEIFGADNLPIMTAIVPKALATAYDTLALSLGGSKEEITSGDFSPALEGLSDVIQKRIARVILVPGLQEGMQIRRVWRRSADEPVGTWREEILADNWKQSGSSIVFIEGFSIQYNDLFRIEYY